MMHTLKSSANQYKHRPANMLANPFEIRITFNVCVCFVNDQLPQKSKSINKHLQGFPLENVRLTAIHRINNMGRGRGGLTLTNIP